MRILHTSDWHLGRTLEGRCRQQEQEAFIDEVCLLADDQKVDCLLLAGDVFDAFNPPAAAEGLFYDALGRLTSNGRRGVVVIAGNHDNPDRLIAASPLARRHGIVLLGLPREEAFLPSSGEGRVHTLGGGPSWLELAVQGCEHSAVILALPYPSESRLKEVLQASLDDEVLVQEAYSKRVELMFQQLSGHYRADTVNLAVSHIFVQGGWPSDSERPIYSVGGACTVVPDALPAPAQYIALGHLHRPQVVAASPAPCRYSGSPLAHSFSEAGQAKSVTIVDAVPGQPSDVREIHLSAGRPLVRWRAGETAQVYRWLDEGRDHRAWIDLEIKVDTPLSIGEIHQLRKACDRFIDIRAVYPEMEVAAAAESLSHLPIDRLFSRFYERKYGCSPEDKLVDLFMELLSHSGAVVDSGVIIK